MMLCWQRQTAKTAWKTLGKPCRWPPEEGASGTETGWASGTAPKVDAGTAHLNLAPPLGSWVTIALSLNLSSNMKVIIRFKQVNTSEATRTVPGTEHRPLYVKLNNQQMLLRHLNQSDVPGTESPRARGRAGRSGQSSSHEKSQPLWQGSWEQPSEWWGSGTDRPAGHQAGRHMGYPTGGSITWGDMRSKWNQYSRPRLRAECWKFASGVGEREKLFLSKPWSMLCTHLTWTKGSFQMQPNDMPLASSKSYAASPEVVFS